MDKRYDKKILFFDVDDTLVDSKTGKVPESTIEALHNLQENGHKICISTGRPLFNKANPSIFLTFHRMDMCALTDKAFTTKKELCFIIMHTLKM